MGSSKTILGKGEGERDSGGDCVIFLLAQDGESQSNQEVSYCFCTDSVGAGAALEGHG